MSKGDFAARLAAVGAQVEAALDSLLGSDALAGEVVRPARLVAAMRHAALDGGKRLRPFLFIESARLFGCDGAGLVRAACAVEMVHCYSLVHDDLPPWTTTICAAANRRCTRRSTRRPPFSRATRCSLTRST